MTPPFTLLFSALSLVAASIPPGVPTPVVGLPCDGCEHALAGMPATPPSTGQIASGGDPGQPMVLYGTVTDEAGRPQAGIVLYAHQTDPAGRYPMASPANRHGALRAWSRTDASGRYRFQTVRPGAYPRRGSPQHIHLHVIEPGCALYYIDDVVFRDDPLLTPALIRRMDELRGGSGIVDPVQADGAWQARRDIVLGHNVPGYPPCGRGNAR